MYFLSFLPFGRSENTRSIQETNERERIIRWKNRLRQREWKVDNSICVNENDEGNK